MTQSCGRETLATQKGKKDEEEVTARPEQKPEKGKGNGGKTRGKKKTKRSWWVQQPIRDQRARGETIKRDA